MAGSYASGESKEERRAEFRGPMPRVGLDPELKDRPERPCARCRKNFQPTARRRVLCTTCFGYANSDAGMD